MADRIDKLLERYFTGGLDLEIKMREHELRQNNSKKDENIGGGRAQNKYSNVFENTLVRIEQDEKLNALQEQWAKIKACVDTFDREHKEVFNQRYRNRMGWEMIAQLHYVDERTPRRWRDALKVKCQQVDL
ncbi:DUF722 domain-containing protein [Weissella viridescens]